MLSDPLHKTSLYKDDKFPFKMFTVNYNECIPPGPGYQYLHWHEDLQFTLVTKGSVSIQVNGVNYNLHSGEAIFINSSFLHMTNHISEDGEYISFNFPTKLLSFFYGSRLEMEFVLPFTSNYSFTAKIFHNCVEWEAKMTESLWNLAKLCSSENMYAKSYEIAIRVTQIWLLLIRNTKDTLEKNPKAFIKKQEHLQNMLAYIHNNYMKEISLQNIAASSNISIGECCRCFKNALHITPYEYLINFRINKGADLLKETSCSVTTIAGMVGFNDSSHFIQLFKKVMHITPNEYKKHLT